MEQEKKIFTVYAAIGKSIEDLIERPTETSYAGGGMVNWGKKNTYPFYIKGLCREVPTLRTVTLGLVDYICGNDVVFNYPLPGRLSGTFDAKGTDARRFLKASAINAVDLGGLRWLITLNKDGNLGSIQNLPVERVRSNKEMTEFYYSEEFDKGKRKAVVYPAWVPGTKMEQSVFALNLWGEGIYPEPIFAASVKAAETERSIDDYHLGNIERGFMGSYLVNFCSGVQPTDEEKKQIERDFTEKFAGAKNGGRIMFNFCRNKDSMAILQKMEVSDYGDKYETLSNHCRQQIFTAFRANPNLFGIGTAQGFNNEEYEAAFKLFNRTMVQPIQRQIIESLERILGRPGVLTISPFTIEGAQGNVE